MQHRMLNSVKDYASSMTTKVSETYTSYTTKDKIDQILIEITGNDTTNVSNQKLLELADATNSMTDAPKIMDHLFTKLKSPGFEWRRIAKSLNAVDFILKHGSPNVVGKLQMQGSSILNTLTNFRYDENGADQGHSLREKARLILELVHNPHKLEIERKEAYEYRKKFYPTQGGYMGQGSGSVGSSTY